MSCPWFTEQLAGELRQEGLDARYDEDKKPYRRIRVKGADRAKVREICLRGLRHGDLTSPEGNATSSTHQVTVRSDLLSPI